MSIYRVSFLAQGEVTVRTGRASGYTVVMADIEPDQFCTLLRQAFKQGLSVQPIEAFLAEYKAQRLKAGGGDARSTP